ncbi:adhesion G-protein coupled receptor G6 isoform X2 [Syngnathus acus]|uniref:adhesion G-protein coupled receptor G6 isoform X2 n=1 Tax=Syngnathus acus TaxID=161584 RepID=UPI001885E62F|nr:adhesion G-protein coupled receptor G6 isoform X2 [Syngnathus acus]
MVARCRVGGAGRPAVILMWAGLHAYAIGCEWSKCGSVSTESEGRLTSPCYPSKYGNSQSCQWSLRAPPGFVVQISFEDFELEEAPGCIYDRLTVATGNGKVKFCGLTAAGLVLNSSGSVMDLDFTSDFSIQKRGFRISFRHVAVALRNQKISVAGGNVPGARVSPSVDVPTLHHLTLCLEMERSGPPQQVEWIFTYSDADGETALALGAHQGRVEMVLEGVTCSLDSIATAADWTSSMAGLCVLWASSSGRVGVYYDGNHWAKTCSDSAGRSVSGGGTFRLGGPSSFRGSVYNVRLWDYAMTVQQLNALTCHAAGNVIDWDNSFWDVPPGLARTDGALSCSVSLPSGGSVHGKCDSSRPGCPAASSPAGSTNTTHATNATHTHVYVQQDRYGKYGVASVSPGPWMRSARPRFVSTPAAKTSSGGPGRRRKRHAGVSGFPKVPPQESPHSRHMSAPPKKEATTSSTPAPPGLPAFPPRLSGGRRPFLALVSTPLRKRPGSGRLPAAATRAQPEQRATAIIAKPPVSRANAVAGTESGALSRRDGASTVQRFSSRTDRTRADDAFALAHSLPFFLHNSPPRSSLAPLTAPYILTPPSRRPDRPGQIRAGIHGPSPHPPSGTFGTPPAIESERAPRELIDRLTGREPSLPLPATGREAALVPRRATASSGAGRSLSHLSKALPEMQEAGPARTTAFRIDSASYRRGLAILPKPSLLPPLWHQSPPLPHLTPLYHVTTPLTARNSPLPLLTPGSLAPPLPPLTPPLHTPAFSPPPALRPPSASVPALASVTPPSAVSSALPLPSPIPARRPHNNTAASLWGAFPCKHGRDWTRDKASFYRLALAVHDGSSTLTGADVEEAVASWLNETFSNWTRAASVDSLSVRPEGHSSFLCHALLRHRDIAHDLSRVPAEVRDRISSGEPRIGAGLEVDTHSVRVSPLENCPEDEALHYRWPESRPSAAHFLPCFPNKEQSATRSCLIDFDNFLSFWSPADFSNCTDIDGIRVSADNAAEVAVQLAAITDNRLSREEVSKVVSKVQELVDVANINTSLASTVVTIISNVMNSPHSALAPASDRALKAVDRLLDKLQFEGSSVSIGSRRLALGVSAFNASAYNGTSFSAFIPANSTDPQIDFESEQMDSLAQVVLPALLLSGVESSAPTRINFLFFGTTGLFQDGRALISYVVASSIVNRSVSKLKEPVEIRISHLAPQTVLSPVCVFWDFSMNGGAGGWNGDGCRVSAESGVNKTVCLCDHLTHFGILMDISGVSPHIDRRNNRILTFITFMGCAVSAVFSAATLLTYAAFQKLRRDYPSKILMNLSASLLLLNMSFLLNGWLSWQRSEALCLAAAALLHYFLLTSFTWMGLESVHMYIALVKVFNTYVHRYILKFCLLGWGLPAVLVALVLAVDKRSYGPQEYGGHFGGDGSSQFCWIRSALVFYTACVAYFCLVFLLNVAMFIVVMLQICGRNGKRGNRTLRQEVVRNLRSVVSLTFLLGMTWAFAFFAWGPVSLVFVYLFAIFNSLQGLFIFFFHCALKENVQKQWRRSLCCARFRLSDNSDWSKTATNNTKKATSEQAAQSLSSGSFGSSTAHWTAKAKISLTPFSNSEKQNPTGTFSSKAQPIMSSSSVLPVGQMIDKVKGYCSARSDGF